MGFISSGNTLALTAYLTQKGRDMLLNGAETDYQIKYFALGDSDSNYKVEIRNAEGYVPDITGDNLDCILSVANNVGIKNFVLYNDTPIVLPPDVPQPPTPLKEVRLKRPDNGIYYNTLNCLINLDEIGRYNLYHSADNASNANGGVVNGALLPMFTDLFSQVDLLTTGMDSPTASDIEVLDDFDFDVAFDPNIYRSLINTYLDGDSTVNQTGDVKSPIVLAFSSRDAKHGAGKGGVSIVGREIGYAFKSFDSANWSFINALNVENVLNYDFFTDENNQLINKYSIFTLASRIDAKNIYTNAPQSFLYRGDKNLTNVNDNTISSFSNDIKYSNQFLKLFKKNSQVIVFGNEIVDNSILSDGLGIVQHEILNLRDFIHVSPTFQLTAGTNEYRTSKLTFNIYPKNNRTATPATLNIIFKFNEDVLLSGDLDYSKISDEGSKQFIQFDFTSTNGVFQNTAKSGTFTRSNCGNGSTGSVVPYTVPKGAYTASTQAGADALALNDLNTYGPINADTFGTCSTSVVYSSAPYSSGIFKNDCTTVGTTGTSVNVYVPVGQFTSTISQLDANLKAVQYAQDVANAQGTCTMIVDTPIGGGGNGCLLAGETVFINNKLETKLIEELEIGDTVYTLSENGKDYDTYPIYKTFKGEVDNWYHIKLIGGKEIKCSSSHLIMVNGKEKRADQLTEDDELMKLVGLDRMIRVGIESIDVIKEKVAIYNIEVKSAHTYITGNRIYHHNKFQVDNGEQF